MEKTAIKYEHAVIAADVAIFTVEENDLKVLLIKMKKDPFSDCWAMPGGLIRPDESLDQAAERLLEDKTGVRNVFLEQLYSFGEVDRDPFGRVVSVAYFALIQNKGFKLKTTAEYQDVAWFSVKEAPKLAYDHEKILACALNRLRSKLGYTNIVCNLMSDEFTLSELQNAYEVILDRKIDKRNFRKKILALGLVKKIGKKTSEAHRPAEFYAFSEKSLKNVKFL
jgi:8-oxo-dGTP diphosphatase